MYPAVTSFSSQNVDSLQKKRGKPFRHVIRTLIPAHLQRSDFLDFSYNGRVGVRTVVDGEISPPHVLQYRCHRERVDDSRVSKTYARWPDGTRGFLYYHCGAESRPHQNDQDEIAPAGQLRFRITESDDPATFAMGHDLKSANGVVWYTFPNPSSNNTIWRLLVNDGLQSPLPPSVKRQQPRSIRSTYSTISRIDQPFLVELKRRFLGINIALKGTEHVVQTLLWNPFRCGGLIQDPKIRPLYQGELSLRFVIDMLLFTISSFISSAL